MITMNPSDWFEYSFLLRLFRLLLRAAEYNSVHIQKEICFIAITAHLSPFALFSSLCYSVCVVANGFPKVRAENLTNYIERCVYKRMVRFTRRLQICACACASVAQIHSFFFLFCCSRSHTLRTTSNRR